MTLLLRVFNVMKIEQMEGLRTSRAALIQWDKILHITRNFVAVVVLRFLVRKSYAVKFTGSRHKSF
jgi:hypothetical protein